MYEDGPTWRIRSDALEAYRAALGFRVLSITTTATDNPDLYSQPLFYSWYVALLCGHEATGWGEFGFSAYGFSNGRAPFRTRPTLAPGTAFTGPVLHSGPLHFWHTNLGRINLDTQLHTYSFTVRTVDVPATFDPSARPLWAGTGSPPGVISWRSKPAAVAASRGSSSFGDAAGAETHRPLTAPVPGAAPRPSARP